MKNSEKIKIYSDLLELKEMSKVVVLRTGEKINPQIIIPNKISYALFKNERLLKPVIQEQEDLIKEIKEEWLKIKGYDQNKKLTVDDTKEYIDFLKVSDKLKAFLDNDQDEFKPYMIKLSLDPTEESGVVSLPSVDPNELFKVSLIPSSLLENIIEIS